MKLTFQTGALLLLIAAVVAMLTRRLRLPYPGSRKAAHIVGIITPREIARTASIDAELMD